MNHNSTDAFPSIYFSTLAEQAPVFEALTELSAMLGSLPTPYIVIHSTRSSGFGVQLDSPAKFEQWRAALQISPQDVTVHASGSNCWLGSVTAFRGVRLDLSGFGVPLTAEQAKPQLVTRYRDSNGTEWVHTGDWSERGDWPLYAEADATGPVQALTVDEIEFGIGSVTPVGGAA